MLRNTTRIGVVLILAALAASCSKSTNSGGTAPTLTAPTFAGPTADTSEAAYLADSIATTFNLIASGYLDLFTGLTGSQSGNTWTWIRTYPTNGTVTWTATASSNGYDWELVEDGTTPSGQFSKWTALTGYESSDGKTGNWILYNSNLPTMGDSVGWSTASNGNLNGTILIYASSGVVAQTLVFKDVSVANRSGDLKIYIGSVSTTYEDISWTASGGTWTIYYLGTPVSTGPL